jgi:hypothetical protein
MKLNRRHTPSVIWRLFPDVRVLLMGAYRIIIENGSRHWHGINSRVTRMMSVKAMSQQQSQGILLHCTSRLRRKACSSIAVSAPFDFPTCSLLQPDEDQTGEQQGVRVMGSGECVEKSS